MTPPAHVLQAFRTGGAMTPRDPAEPGRASTNLEFFYDLVFAAAVSLVSASLHTSVTDGRIGAGLAGYAMVFFAIWWAWMNFTWFASAYDCDDTAYRLTTMVQMTGVLILAAGVPDAMDRGDFTRIVVAIMPHAVPIAAAVTAVVAGTLTYRARHADLAGDAPDTSAVGV